MKYPKNIYHWINNKETVSSSKNSFAKISPIDGKNIAQVTRGNSKDVKLAVTIAAANFDKWRNTSIMNRAEILRNVAILIKEKEEEIAEIVHLETGKSKKDALNEVNGAIELGFFMAGEGRRFYGKTTTSAMPNRWAYTIRQPIGVTSLIVPFNTPIANVAWKTFPALLCGNTVVLKASKDTPYTPIWFAKILKEAGLPSGVFNVIQGFGEEVGKILVENENIDLISFTGSCETGEYIQKAAASRFAKVSLELGGKNPFIVCDDADLEVAAEFGVLSAFSNAGQRCASGSRIIVFDKVYEKFKNLFIKKTKKLKVGSQDTDDLGPVINERQLNNILDTVKRATAKNSLKLLTGGYRLKDNHKNGYYIAPTLLEAKYTDEPNHRSRNIYHDVELFGPVTCLYIVKNFNDALELANDSQYGLTAAIHTSNMHRIQEFINQIKVGVVSINGPSYGSEPHMPFGGLKKSGNGFREPGTEALDVYSEWKTVYIKHDPSRV